MAISFDETKKQHGHVLEDFIKEYNTPYWRQWVNGIGFSVVGMFKAEAPDKDEPCIVVILWKKFPSSVSLPQEYKGMKVFSKFVGKVVAH